MVREDYQMRRIEILEKEASSRLDAKILEVRSTGETKVNVTQLRSEIRGKFYREQADGDREYDEYVRSSWGSQRWHRCY